MRKTLLITKSGPLDLTFTGDSAIANVSGQSPMWVVPTEDLDDIDGLEDHALRNGIFNAMYRLQPGERRTLAKEKYQVILGAQAVAFLSCNGKPTQPAEPTTTA
ncbi:hypothetical protein [Spirosoma pomorum]